ncbi:MAG: GIY-YIG nuclease family protein [Patescibacteria group bacterium]|nr:GIY-YIG nuclease family protein [Patescibacteria group bacterium]
MPKRPKESLWTLVINTSRARQRTTRFVVSLLTHGTLPLYMKSDLLQFKKRECPEPVEGHYFIYILECCDKSFYCGSTRDIKQRIQYHNNKKGSLWTSRRLPIKLVYYGEYYSLLLARKRERQIKGWIRKKKVNLILGIWKKIENSKA